MYSIIPLVLLVILGFASKSSLKKSDGYAWIYTILCIIALINFAF